MIKTITSNDVLRYFYGEISKSEKLIIEEALAFDNGLQNIYCEIEMANRMVEKTTFPPHKNVIDNILLYSKSFATIH